MSDIGSFSKGGCGRGGGGVGGAALTEWKNHGLLSTLKMIVIAVYVNAVCASETLSFMRENSK